jgi:UDP-N-acetyl-2-amino-2-deoxyglucuronate dehydrogenase
MTHSKPRPRIALVGLGMASGPHASSLVDLQHRVEVAAAFSPTAARRAAFAARFPFPVTGDLDAIVDDRTITAAIVLAPPAAHRPLVERLAAAGKHVLLEKPLAATLADAEAVVAACRRAGVLLAVVFQHRYRPAAVALAERVHTGALGALASASASVRWWRPQSYYDEPGRGTLARDGGGVLITQAIHTLDLLISLTGLPCRVTGLAHTSSAHRMECEDTAAALLQFAGGASAVVQATTAAYPGFAERIELNGTLGTATYEAGELKAQLASGEIIQAGARQATGGGADPMAFDHAPHRAVLQDFVHAVRTGSTPMLSGRSAVAVQRLIEAIIDSARRGVAVSIDDAAR